MMGVAPRIGNSKVLESRETEDGTTIRRRRVSPDGKRFTTYERIEPIVLMVKKRSGNREPYDRDKLISAVRNSVGKFMSSSLEVEDVVEKVTNLLRERGDDVVTSAEIGAAVLDVLAEQNEVAYIRFASVFGEFKTLDDFEQILKEQKRKKARK